MLVHPVHELVSRQGPIRLDDGPLPVQPARLDGIEPGALHRQPTHQTLVHGYANPLTTRRFVKLAESPKVLKMLPYGRIPATRSRCVRPNMQSYAFRAGL